MPLVTCPECGSQVSSAAPTCPRCGFPNPGRAMMPPPPPRRAPGGSGGVWILLAIGVVALGVMGAGGWGLYRFLQRINPPGGRGGPELVDYQEAPDTGRITPDTVPTWTVPPSDTAATRTAPSRETGSRRMPPLPDSSTYELSVVTQQPELINRGDIGEEMARAYPPLLRDAGVAGTVTIRMRVDHRGRVDPASVTIESSTHEAFSDAATRVVRQMRFRPAEVEGVPVAVWVVLPVTFQLQS